MEKIGALATAAVATLFLPSETTQASTKVMETNPTREAEGLVRPPFAVAKEPATRIAALKKSKFVPSTKVGPAIGGRGMPRSAGEPYVKQGPIWVNNPPKGKRFEQNMKMRINLLEIHQSLSNG